MRSPITHRVPAFPSIVAMAQAAARPTLAEREHAEAIAELAARWEAKEERAANATNRSHHDH